jgi:hypothetical protein
MTLRVAIYAHYGPEEPLIVAECATVAEAEEVYQRRLDRFLANRFRRAPEEKEQPKRRVTLRSDAGQRLTLTIEAIEKGAQ